MAIERRKPFAAGPADVRLDRVGLNPGGPGDVVRADRNAVTPAGNRRPPRDGKIVLVAAVFLLLMVVLLALVGNAGHAVNQKIEVQNAADSMAFASSLWMARGMNGVTHCNHLIGEATAIGVIHEAIGGPEQRLNLRDDPQESETLDIVIRFFAAPPPSVGSAIGAIQPNFFIPFPVTRLDQQIIRFVTRRTSPSGNDQEAWATIYDARMTLKRKLVAAMGAKALANVLFLIPPPLGYPFAAAGVVTHLAGTATIVLIGKEWLLLEALEIYAGAASPLAETVFAGQLIPTLAGFSAAIAGLDPAAPDADPEGGYAVEQIEPTFERLGETFSVESAMVPGQDDRRLPVVFEPPPNRSGTSGAYPEAWGEDLASPLPDFSDQIDDARDAIDDALGELGDALGEHEDAAETLREIESDVQDRIEEGDLHPETLDRYENELADLRETIAEIETQAERVRDSIGSMESNRDRIEDELSSLIGGRPGNLSIKHLPDEMDIDQERVSQWTRATMPNLDALRAPVLSLLEAQLPLSNAAEHYEKWTNRYALVHAWRFRDGRRLRKTGEATADWQAAEDPMAMLVMPGTFSGDLPAKGREDWTGSDEASRRRAESSFTMLAVASRDYESIFAADVLKPGQSNGLTAIAQAIVYNANRQRPGGASDTQPTIGWDTLNWDRTASAPIPEWGGRGRLGESRWPWELLDGPSVTPGVKLNWQAKLVPVTKGRLSDAEAELDGEMAAAVEFAEKHADLIAH